MDFPGKSTEVSVTILQGIFPIQEANPHFRCLQQWQANSLPLGHLGNRVRPKTVGKGFPGSSRVKNQPANARDIGLIPDSGRSHTIQEDCTRRRACKPMRHNYSVCNIETATTDPTCHNYGSAHAPGPMIGNKRSHCNERPVRYTQKVAPAGRTREKPAAAKTQPNQKLNK